MTSFLILQKLARLICPPITSMWQ